jgi:2-oxoglutarate ferredoxin oxidoreductase subunit alpha
MGNTLAQLALNIELEGLEKQDVTGNISYDSDNHQYMVKIRQKKVDLIANYIPNRN